MPAMMPEACNPEGSHLPYRAVHFALRHPVQRTPKPATSSPPAGTVPPNSSHCSLGGSQRGFEQFIETHWNLYRYPDPVDKPSPLFDQLQWLREAGFATVDCFWLRAGHAVYGGYRSPSRTGAPPLPFSDALAAAERAQQ